MDSIPLLQTLVDGEMQLTDAERELLDLILPSLSAFDLDDDNFEYSLPAESVQTLIPELRKMTGLTSFSLCLSLGNDAAVQATIATELAEVLTMMTGLTALTLTGEWSTDFAEFDGGNWQGMGIGDAGARILVPVLGKLRSLCSLNLAKNSFGCEGAKVLANMLGGVTSHLTSLDLTNNNTMAEGLEVLCSVLSSKSHITQLILGDDSVTTGVLQALAAEPDKLSLGLRVLDLGCNYMGRPGNVEMSALANLLGQTTGLTSLTLHSNDLGDDDVRVLAPALGNMLQLTYLNLENNHIGDEGAQKLASELLKMVNLSTLNLRDNNIENLPVKLKDCRALTDLECDENPLLMPDSVVSQGTGAILHFLRDIDMKGSEKMAVVKLVFVGPPRVGKSSLFDALRTGEPGAEGKKTTVGIDLGFIDWGQEKDAVTFRVWDTAGQDEYGVMQRLFFTKKQCIYLLVVDISRKLEAGDFAEIKNRVDVVQAVAPGACFILVGTKSDKAQEDAEARLASVHKKLAAALADDLEHVFNGEDLDTVNRYLGQPFPVLVKESFAVSTTDPRLPGLQDLKKQLMGLVLEESSPNFLGVLPKSWVALMEELKVLQEGSMSKGGSEGGLKLVETVARFNEWAVEKVGKPETDFAQALDYLSAVGYVLRFEKLEGLEGKVFLDPRYLVKLLGKLFDHTLLTKLDKDNALTPQAQDHAHQLATQGILQTKFIPVLLGGVIDTRSAVELIEHFKLGYGIWGKEGTVPDQVYLPSKWEPPQTDKWTVAAGDDVRGWRLQQRRGEMPAGLFETMLVQSGICTKVQPTEFWVGGVFMERHDNKVQIRIAKETLQEETGGGEAVNSSIISILAKRRAQDVADGKDEQNKVLWEDIGPVVIQAFKVHKELFGGDQLISYFAACPEHPGGFLRLREDTLLEMFKANGSSGVEVDGCVGYLGKHPEVSRVQLGPNPELLANARLQVQLEDVVMAVRALPTVIDNAKKYLARLVVEVGRESAPRAFAVVPEKTSAAGSARADMLGVFAEVVKKAEKPVALDRGDLLKAAQRSFLVAYHFLAQGLFQDDARLFLLCEKCFKVPAGHGGYLIRRTSDWGKHLSSTLTVLLALGKLASVVGPVFGAGEVTNGFVNTVKALQEPLKDTTKVPRAALKGPTDLVALTKGAEKMELTSFLKEHDRGEDPSWRKCLTSVAFPDSPEGKPAALWLCAQCDEASTGPRPLAAGSSVLGQSGPTEKEEHDSVPESGGRASWCCWRSR